MLIAVGFRLCCVQIGAHCRHPEPAAAAAGGGAGGTGDPIDDKIHFIFSSSCSDFQRKNTRSLPPSLTHPACLPPPTLARSRAHSTYLPTYPPRTEWQSELVFHTHAKVGQKGRITRLVSGCDNTGGNTGGKQSRTRRRKKTPLSPFPFRPPSSALGLTLSPTHHTHALSLSLRSPPLYTDAGFSYLPGQSVKDVAVIRKSTNPGAMVHVTPYFKESKACTIAPSTAFWPISHAFRALMPRSHFSKVYVPNPSRTHTHARRGPYSTECPG